MPKVVKVTPAQVNAAKLKIKRSAVTGKLVTSGVSRIASARRAPAPRNAEQGGHDPLTEVPQR